MLQTLSGNLHSIALQYPGILQSLNFSHSIADLTKIQTLASQLTTSPASTQAILSQIQQALNDLSQSFLLLSNEFKLS